MKTLKYVKENYKSSALDGRDMNRFMQFIPENELKDFGFELNDKNKGKHKKIPFTRKNILKQLKKDVAFGFEKAINQRGLSSEAMYYVVGMWNWILEEGLENFDNYSRYGMPLFKATALKYNFNDPTVE